MNNKTAIIFSLNFTIGVFLVSLGFCDEQYTLDRIVVKSQAADYQGMDSIKNNYSVQTVTGEDIKAENLNSLADVLDYVSGIDLRYRGQLGVQGDLSLRGSNYEQVAILIDGVKVMDPQTGHHNLDIPLTEYDVEKIEVMKEPGSSLYGSGALAGSINIITKKPTKKGVKLDTMFGQNALFGQTISLSFPSESFSGRLSFDNKVSKAARPNTDFDYKTTSLYLNRQLDNKELDTLFGYQKKDFGASSFYSNLFPEEEEHTETVFVRAGLNSKEDFGLFKNNIYLRRHRDKFILQRNNPTSVNYHTTYVYGLDSNLSVPLEYGNLLLGAETGSAQINSTNLGKHERLHEAGSIGFVPKLTDRLSADLRGRLDYCQNWDWHESFNFGAAYYLIDQRLKLKGSFAKAFRIPSFTELYYSDPANIGNPNLKVEKTDSYILGLNFVKDFMEFDLDGFYRRGTNLIDWVRQFTSNPWNATNLGSVDYRGIEFCSAIKPDINFQYFNLDNVKFSYVYNSADKKATGFLSKYALDILKHQYILDLYSSLFGLKLNWQLSYNKRYYGETYFVGSIYLAKNFVKRDFSLEPYIKIDNFSNAKYTENAGVLQPGRWIKGGVKFEW